MKVNIVDHGNSLTHGAYIDGNADPVDRSGIYPVQQATLMGMTEGVDLIEAGFNSHTTALMLSGFDAEVHVHYDATADLNIVVFWESTNSFYFGVSLALEKTQVENYCAYAKGKGWKVILGTVIQRGTTGSGTLADWRIKADGINDWYRDEYTNIADGLADFRKQDYTFIEEFTDNGPTRTFIDTAHLNELGYSFIAVEAARACNQLINNYMLTDIATVETQVYSAYNGKAFSQDGINYYRGVADGDAVSVSSVGLTSY